MGRIVVVDDDPDVLDALRLLLESAVPGASLVLARSADEALAVLARERADLVISDFRMPGMDGAEFLRRVHDLAPGVPRILVTAYPVVPEGSAERVLQKPFKPPQLLAAVEAALASRPHPPAGPGAEGRRGQRGTGLKG